MFSDLHHLQLLFTSLAAAQKAPKTIQPNTNTTATKESDVAAQDPKYPNDILAYVLSCTADDDANTVCTFVKPGSEVDLSSED